MSVCVNTAILNKYLDKQEKQELAFEILLESIEEEKEVINEMVENIKRKCRDANIEFEKEMIEDVCF